MDNKEVQCLLKERDLCHKSGNKDLFSAGRHNLKQGIKSAKLTYKEKVEDQFTSRDGARMCQGIQHSSSVLSFHFSVNLCNCVIYGWVCGGKEGGRECKCM